MAPNRSINIQYCPSMVCEQLWLASSNKFSGSACGWWLLEELIIRRPGSCWAGLGRLVHVRTYVCRALLNRAGALFFVVVHASESRRYLPKGISVRRTPAVQWHAGCSRGTAHMPLACRRSWLLVICLLASCMPVRACMRMVLLGWLLRHVIDACPRLVKEKRLQVKVRFGFG